MYLDLLTKEKETNHNIWSPAGVGNTWNLTDYARESPRAKVSRISIDLTMTLSTSSSSSSSSSLQASKGHTGQGKEGRV